MHGNITNLAQLMLYSIVMNLPLELSSNLACGTPAGGNWWLQEGGDDVGYLPSSIFKYLADSASTVEWGGEVHSPDASQTSTQMGSGNFPKEGFGKAGYIKNVQMADSSKALISPCGGVGMIAEQPKCYNVQSGTDNTNGSTYIFYGGPGKNPNCP